MEVRQIHEAFELAIAFLDPRPETIVITRVCTVDDRLGVRQHPDLIVPVPVVLPVDDNAERNRTTGPGTEFAYAADFAAHQHFVGRGWRCLHFLLIQCLLPLLLAPADRLWHTGRLPIPRAAS